MFHVEQLTPLIHTLGGDPVSVIGGLEQYANLLREWNRKTNLISRNTETAIFERHIVPSIAYGFFIDNDKTIVDIGTGAGLPGLVLKILFPKIKIDLIDSNRKKILFCKYVINELGLKDVEAILERIENHHRKYDITLFRAVAAVEQLKTMTAPILNPGGYLLSLKGEEETAPTVEVFALPPELKQLAPHLNNSVMMKAFPEHNANK